MNHEITSVSSEELNDKDLLDQIIRLSRERNINLTIQVLEIVTEDGRRQNLEVCDLSSNGMMKYLFFLKALRRSYEVQLGTLKYNERWHAPDLLCEPASLGEWPEWLRSVFYEQLTDMREKFLLGHVSVGTIFKACEFMDMAARWSPACLLEAVALLTGVIRPGQPSGIRYYLLTIGLNSSQESYFQRLASHASDLAGFESSLDTNVLSWHTSTQAIISKGWHQHLESFSSVGANLKNIYGRRTATKDPDSLSWLLDSRRDHILQYITDPEIELDEFIDIIGQKAPDGFRLVRRLSARSAFKIVYLAEDQTGRRVVLKRYKSWDAKATQILMERLATNPEKMLRKDTITEWLGLIRHSNIQPCMLVKNAFGEPFMLEPLLQHTLDDYVDRSDPEAPELISTFRGIVDAVAYLHERGLIHADIKPDNIGMVGSLAILLDFGIATFDPQIPRGNPGSIKTRAPELFSPDAIPTRASDVWALGATLMCVITHGEYPLLSKEEVRLIMNMGLEQRQAFEDSLQQRIVAYQNDPSEFQARMFRALRYVPDQIRNIIYSACGISSTDRPSAHELLDIFDLAIDTLG